MKMSEFEVGKRYWNPRLNPGCFIRSNGAVFEFDGSGHPYEATVLDVTLNDWEEVPAPWTEAELRSKRRGPETMWEYLVSTMRDGKFCDFEVTHKIKTANDLKDFMVRSRPLSDKCRAALFDAIRPSPDPCDDAWEKVSFGCAFPCCHDEQCAFSVKKAKEWFIIGWQARQDHALEIGK